MLMDVIKGDGWCWDWFLGLVFGIGFSNRGCGVKCFGFVSVRRFWFLFWFLCFTLGAQGARFFRQGLVCELLGRITLVERSFFCPAENNLLTVIL